MINEEETFLLQVYRENHIGFPIKVVGKKMVLFLWAKARLKTNECLLLCYSVSNCVVMALVSLYYIFLIPHRLERGMSASEDAGSRRGVDCVI